MCPTKVFLLNSSFHPSPSIPGSVTVIGVGSWWFTIGLPLNMDDIFNRLEQIEKSFNGRSMKKMCRSVGLKYIETKYFRGKYFLCSSQSFFYNTSYFFEMQQNYDFSGPINDFSWWNIVLGHLNPYHNSAIICDKCPFCID